MLLSRDNSLLLLVDVQEKLTPHVLHATEMVARCQWLMRLASDVNVPVVVSEQYPRGLGQTVLPLRSVAGETSALEKVSFSCYREPLLVKGLLSQHKKQVVIIGIETHVCVVQTALDMQKAGWDVFVVVDAVSSRHELDHKYGLKRMKQNGIHLVTSEMVFFEWVERAGTPEFKALSQSYLKE